MIKAVHRFTQKHHKTHHLWTFVLVLVGGSVWTGAGNCPEFDYRHYRWMITGNM